MRYYFPGKETLAEGKDGKIVDISFDWGKTANLSKGKLALPLRDLSIFKRPSYS